ncbi:hypothetical protein LMH73_023825 [Vibrio splendidus]|nr:hypothetical protein [Vibrio splendidus]MCC4883084.1 hypothetical protein [Vibrio splendidus]
MPSNFTMTPEQRSQEYKKEADLVLLSRGKANNGKGMVFTSLESTEDIKRRLKTKSGNNHD